MLFLVNGTVTRDTGGLHHALSTVSTIFPHVMANNAALVLTNIVDPLSLNFCPDTIPEGLKDVRQFQLDNPISLQRKYLELKNDPDREQGMVDLSKAVKDSEGKALEMLVELVDWLSSLEPQASDGGRPPIISQP